MLNCVGKQIIIFLNIFCFILIGKIKVNEGNKGKGNELKKIKVQSFRSFFIIEQES